MFRLYSDPTRPDTGPYTDLFTLPGRNPSPSSKGSLPRGPGTGPRRSPTDVGCVTRPSCTNPRRVVRVFGPTVPGTVSETSSFLVQCETETLKQLSELKRSGVKRGDF